MLEHNSAGFRSVPGTSLKRSDGITVYTPPQDKQTILRLMDNLEVFINDDRACELDPLIKLAIIHHQFESIHPFYDGNGRTGRIICVLYLVLTRRLDIPILYLSRYITHNNLNSLLETGLVDRIKLGRAYYYMNIPLMNLFMNVSDSTNDDSIIPIESVSQ